MTIAWKPRKAGGLISWGVRSGVQPPPPPPPPPPPGTTRVVSEVLANQAGVIAANRTNLKCAFFDQNMPHLLLAPMDKWANGTTDAAGRMTRTVTSALVSGGEGWLDVTDSDGNPSTNHSAFIGKVIVT